MSVVRHPFEPSLNLIGDENDHGEALDGPVGRLELSHRFHAEHDRRGWCPAAPRYAPVRSCFHAGWPSPKAGNREGPFLGGSCDSRRVCPCSRRESRTSLFARVGVPTLMDDDFPTVKAAAVQAASVFLDRERSVDRACELIEEAGRNGAQLIVFPEGFVPGHPIWFKFHTALADPVSKRLSTDLFKNAVEVPGPDTDRLGEAAREADAIVVVGVCEREAGTTGTMYNSQLFFSPSGSLIGKHQKIRPTTGERLVHAGGRRSTFGAIETGIGPISGLICGENSNPFAVAALTACYPRVHAMSWPPYSRRPLRCCAPGGAWPSSPFTR